MIQVQQNGLKAMQRMITEQQEQIEALSKQMNRKQGFLYKKKLLIHS